MLYETRTKENMFAPDTAEIVAIRNDVSALRQHYSDCLQEDDTGQEELEYLSLMLQRADGTTSCQTMAEEGAKLLEKVQTKLKAAAEDLQRFDGESAASTNSTGHRADRLTKAATALRDAQERLAEIASQ